MKTNRKTNAFTLVEILIVVVILGILAAIVIPQFSQHAVELRESALISSLQSLRTQISFYKSQHNDALPATGALLTTALTSVTDKDGNAWQDLETSGTFFGPYMNRIPTNPFSVAAGNDKGNVINEIQGEGGGWYYKYDSNTGEWSLLAVDGFSSPDGVAHVDY